VALGNSAAESLLGKTGVQKLRVGPGRPAKDLPDVRVITTLHPAAALRQADLFPHIVTDIGKVVTDARVWDPPRYVVLDDQLDAEQALAELERRDGPLVVDIEVDIEKDTAFGHPNQYGMLCVGVGYAAGRVAVFTDRALGWEGVRDRLGRLLRGRRLIAHNGKFDLAGLYPVLGPLTLWFDTMIASYVFDERPGIHGLKHLAQEYLGAPAYDEEVKKYLGPRDGYGVIPRGVLHKYNAYDVSCTYALWELWEQRFGLAGSAERRGQDDRTLRDVHDFLVAASNELMYIELNGIAVDRQYLDVLTDKYLEVLDGIEAEIDNVIAPTIKRMGDYDKQGGLNPRSPLQVKKYLADHRIEVDSTNEDTLKFLLRPDIVDPTSEVSSFVRTLLKHRREAKLYGTYVKGIRKRLYRGRVYPSFLVHGTTTGRLACRNPNLQNVPRESSIRRLFVPAKPENVFVQADYSQAELRVLCYLAGDAYFRDIFNGGERDLFDELTPVLYPHLPPKEQVDPAVWKETRIRVKAYVYGLAYGREAGSIAMEFGISEQEAQKGMARFFDVIPEIVEFREQTKQTVRSGQDLVTPWGRRRRFMLITKENVKSVMNEALAFMPQSTASDMCLQAATWVRRDLKGLGYIRNLVHDSILAECHEEDAEEVAALLNRRMVEAAELIVGDYVKFATDYKIGRDWGSV
jgi:DNA polymerase I